MGLCENVAPVELVTGKGKSTPCSTLCNLTYDYGNSDCVLSNKGDHLDIQCYDGTNQVDFTGYKNLSVVSVRLYNGSLNKYDLSLIHISDPRDYAASRMPSSA